MLAVGRLHDGFTMGVQQVQNFLREGAAALINITINYNHVISTHQYAESRLVVVVVLHEIVRRIFFPTALNHGNFLLRVAVILQSA